MAKLKKKMKTYLVGISSLCVTSAFLIYAMLALNIVQPMTYYGYKTNFYALSNRRERPFYMDLDCEEMTNKFNKTNVTTEAQVLKHMRNIKFVALLEEEIRNATDRCAKLDEIFGFRKYPLSEEEAEYPLAYGILVYKDVIQVLFMLSVFYHPQNEYCIGVSANAGPDFIEFLKNLTNCFPNVHFMERPEIHWGSHEIINSLFTILDFLSHLKSDWKYFQYLSGFDIPLKTNLEMVKIFKALNGSANVDIVPYPGSRLNGKKWHEAPLPLYKSSMSALIPRKTANEMAFSRLPRDLLYYLNNTHVADESFWGTLLANKELFNITGAVSGSEWLKLQQSVSKQHPSILQKGLQQTYYISRYQVYYQALRLPCRGYYKANSCVFSIFDLPDLMASKPLVAHKMYMEVYPAGFFCALREIQNRTDNPDLYPFNTTFYENLPQVQLTRGIPLANVTTETLMF